MVPGGELTATAEHKVTGAPPFSTEVNVTVPVGLVEPETTGAIVAVNVTCWLTAEVEGDADTVVVVAVEPTTWFAVPVLPAKFVLPDV
jgi:hypothetical protein